MGSSGSPSIHSGYQIPILCMETVATTIVNILQTIVNSGLLFTDGPVFTKEPVSVTGNAGERVSLECEVDSNPPAQYEWTRDGEVCGTSGIFIIIFYFCDSLLKYYPNISMKI